MDQPYIGNKNAKIKINFLISHQKHVVGTQKNRFHETVLLSTKTNGNTDE